jgi:adenosylcobinamide-GDP ribazoletransferase
LRAAPIFFPLVGTLMGAVAAAAMFGLDQVLPSLPATVVVVLFLEAASAGLHLDGLADTADGLLSARPRERVLEIMRDSRLGTMGALAVVAVLLLKVGFLDAVEEGLRWRAVLLAPPAGRCAALLVMSLFPYARRSGGLATVFQPAGRRARLLAALSVAWLLAAGWLTLAYRGLVTAGLSLVVALLFALYVRRRIGGYTGDTLGATSELVEVIPFLVAALWPM